MIEANFDGSSTSASSGGGGIVRTIEGRVINAFSNFYGFVINNEAEMHAIWDLIQICETSNVVLSVVESDSMSIIHMLKGEMAIQWKCSKWCNLVCTKHATLLC